jgi:mevalonate kinase
LLARRRERQREAASPLRFDFSDPHRGKGGLGASSAQFALLYAALENWASFEPAKADWKKLLEEYRACAWNGEGSAPSGADVVSQLCGGVTWYDGREFRTRSFEWKFPTLGFTLLRTGAKLATHEHLRQSGTTSETKAALHESLRSAVLQATNSFETSNESQLVASVDQAAKALAQAGLTAERTQSLLSELRSRDGLVVAAKGCGAMGADVMLVIHERNRSREIENCARELELEICGSTDSLSQGLKIEPSVG